MKKLILALWAIFFTSQLTQAQPPQDFSSFDYYNPPPSIDDTSNVFYTAEPLQLDCPPPAPRETEVLHKKAVRQRQEKLVALCTFYMCLHCTAHFNSLLLLRIHERKNHIHTYRRTSANPHLKYKKEKICLKENSFTS